MKQKETINELKCPKCGEVFQVDEAGYAAIVKQVRDKEFSKEIKSKEEQFESDKAQAVQIAKMEAEKEFGEILNKKEAEIIKLKSEITEERAIAVSNIDKLALNKDMEITKLKNKLDSFDKDKKLEINELVSKKDAEISKLKAEKEIVKKEYLFQEQNLKSEYKIILKDKDDEIERLKNQKAKLSVKLLGESLEQHCLTLFNQVRPVGFKSAYFEKDNKVVENSKGDFIFRDYDDEGNEYISIMFEMKTEADETKTKHKNEDFLKELDKDRKLKKCEYAVLVSMLEEDNEFYNAGIVDVSHKFEKMYVVRPQCFIPVITLLRNAAMNSIKYQKELEQVKKQNIDVTNFENDLSNFKEKFLKNCINATNNFNKTITEIDKAIDALQKAKNSLMLSDKQIQQANNKLEDLTIKKLTKNNPTMQAKFEEARKSAQKQLPKNDQN